MARGVRYEPRAMIQATEALALFHRPQALSLRRGLILVITYGLIEWYCLKKRLMSTLRSR